ncbi:MAG: GIY-YIG nuclease family protein [Clostridiales bacterium]|nr:GIY-YIG nuclease family protein [Clostridiales bacterium]
MYYVYILRCKDGSLYTGATNDVVKRLAAHNLGRGAKYTRGRRPLTLVYTEACNHKGQALRREAEIKKLKRAKKLLMINDES